MTNSSCLCHDTKTYKLKVWMQLSEPPVTSFRISGIVTIDVLVAIMIVAEFQHIIWLEHWKLLLPLGYLFIELLLGGRWYCVHSVVY